MKTYTDKNIVCPFYTREEPSNVARKIHCEGYKKGNHIHMCFDTIELKKAHKNDFCKQTEQKAENQNKCYCGCNDFCCILFQWKSQILS